jgi:hypothetical protein
MGDGCVVLGAVSDRGKKAYQQDAKVLIPDVREHFKAAPFASALPNTRYTTL